MEHQNNEKPTWGADKIGALIDVEAQVIRRWHEEGAWEARKIYKTDTKRFYVFASEFLASLKEKKPDAQD